MERNLQIQSPYGEQLSIRKMEGVEGISQLYQYQLILISNNPNLQGKDGIGKSLTININTKRAIRYLNGIITDFGYLHEADEEIGYHLYTCTVRPSLWYLSQRVDSRVFVDKNIIDIADTILNEMDIAYQNKCQSNYRNYGHSIQYQETSLDYLQRLFEQEGIYYYFEHTDGNHILILSDNNAQQVAIMDESIIPYHSKYVASGTPDQPYIDDWEHTNHLNTKQVSVNDYNYQTAKTKLTSHGITHDLGGRHTEQYEFYTNFKNLEQAEHYKIVRTEDYKAQSQIVTASGNVLSIAPGYTFRLERHPRQASNGEYLITQANYHFQEVGNTTGDDQSYYRIDFTAIPKAHQYRTPKTTAKPRMLGSQAATVTGPAGEEVYTNEYGDIKLQFHWDRYGAMNEKSSDWVRVAQSSAGGSYGSINTPRIGEEVLVDFINGDSDRPIVVGRLYNSNNPPPWGFPSAAKKSGIRSKSFNSPLSNFNELMFDDTAGNEMVNFQAQKNLTSLVGYDETRTVNNNRTTTIVKDETVTVRGNRAENITGNETLEIHGNRTEKIEGTETVTIHGARSETLEDNETIKIEGTRTETVDGAETITTGPRTRTVKGAETVEIQGENTVTVTKSKTETVTESRSINAKNQQHTVKNDTHTVASAYTLSAGEAITETTKVFTISAETLVVTVGQATLIMDKSGTIQLNGSSIEIGGSSNIDVVAPNVNIN